MKAVFPFVSFIIYWSTDKQLDTLFWKSMIWIVMQQEALCDNSNNGG